MQKPRKTLDEILKKWKLKEQLKEKMINYRWQEIVGKNFSSLAKPETVKNRVLFLKVKNPSWAQHLSFSKEDLIKKINYFFKSNIIKDIKFQGGYLVEEKLGEKAEEKKIEGFFNLTREDLEKRRNVIKKYKGDDIVKQKIFFLLEKEYLLKKKKENDGWIICKECGVYSPPEKKNCLFCRK